MRDNGVYALESFKTKVTPIHICMDEWFGML